MKHLLKPYSLFIAVTIPQLILIMLYVNSYCSIEPSFPEDVLSIWIRLGSILAIVCLAYTAYGIFSFINNIKIKPVISLFFIFTYIPFLYYYFLNQKDIIPFKLTLLLPSNNLLMYVITFFIPVIMYAIILLVYWLTPDINNSKLWKNLLGTLLIPLFWYTQIIIGIPFFKNNDLLFDRFREHVVLVLLVASLILFLFFLIRTIYLFIKKRESFFHRYNLAWKIPLTIIFPLVGLAFNNNLIDIKLPTKDMFGDFSHPCFYILALLNGILLSIPEIKNISIRFFLFIARSITYSFSLYFFLVFLPYFPIAIVAIFLFGFGLLMLTPLFLLPVHTKILYNDYKILKKEFKIKFIYGAMIVGILVIPSLITGSYIHDKINLNMALQYIYEPDYSTDSSHKINTSTLKNILEAIKNHKRRTSRDHFFDSKGQPYLSMFYKWLVLDNMTLSNHKIECLEKVFFGRSDLSTNSSQMLSDKNPLVIIEKTTAESKYYSKEKYWKSWIHLNIKNHSNRSLQEYSTEIKLPAGTWISNYYLMVNNQKSYGLLTEKKSATWIYKEIVRTNRDPGILYYTSRNKVAFKVFPFESKQTRITGIEFIHKQPIAIQIDEKNIKLGNADHGDNPETVYSLENKIVFIPKQVLSDLPKVYREPYYHFIIDFSYKNEKKLHEFIRRIEDLLEKNFLDSRKIKISAVNYGSVTIDLKNDWKKELEKIPFKGGFFLERAVKKIMVQNYQDASSDYPVIIVIADNLDNMITIDGYHNFPWIIPDTDEIYLLNDLGKLNSYSLMYNSIRYYKQNVMQFPRKHVLAWPNSKRPQAYLADNKGEGAVIVKDLNIDYSNIELSNNNWENGLILQGMWIGYNMYHENSNKKWLSLLEKSFTTKILSPVTSYIVVETDAQKQTLLNKQKQVLSSKKIFDIDEDVIRMSEPSLMVLLILILILCLIIRLRFPSLDGRG